MSQAEVARAMHTSQSAVARIESAQENITLDTLERLINTLNGRLHISIPPHEWATTQAPAWWSAPVPSGSVDAWNLTTLIARKTPTREQVIMGLERPRESILIGETPSIAAGDLLIDGKGTTYFVRGKNG